MKAPVVTSLTFTVFLTIKRAIHKEIWMNSRTKNILFWVVVGLFMILLFNLFSVPTP